MLSYMLPVEEKPPLPKNMQLQLELRGVRASATDSSVSTTSTSSSADTNTSATATAGTPTPTADPAPAPPPAKTHRNKLVVNGTKHPTLKRVSFGSSKGSMVETLIFESPVQEEPEASPILEDATPFPADADSESEPSKRVRVTFFESLRPLVVTSPSPEPSADLVEPAPLHAATPLALTMAATAAEHATAAYTRQESTDSGWDNPFRPDGDLSREADEIVELIKGGKPITPTPGSTAPQLPEPPAAASAAAGDGKAAAASADGPQSPQLQQQQQQLQQAASPQLTAKQASPLQQQQVANSKPAAGAGANGNAPGAAANAAPDSKPAAVEVQRGTVVQPSDASQVEHVVIKKKPKCKCCVIQ